MAIQVYGTLTLTSIPASGGSVTFETDPEEYAAHEQPTRRTRKRTLGGGSTVMDFGVWAADGDVTCSWTTNMLNKATVLTLLEFKRREQVVFLLEDGEGNSYRVVIAEFKPKQAYGYPGLYRGVMTFWIREIVNELGAPYTGS